MSILPGETYAQSQERTAPTPAPKKRRNKIQKNERERIRDAVQATWFCADCDAKIRPLHYIGVSGDVNPNPEKYGGVLRFCGWACLARHAAAHTSAVALA